MKKIVLPFLLFIFCNPHIMRAQELPNSHDIVSSMELANDYFMNKWPDPGANIVTDRSRPSNLWTRATYYEGLMQLYYTNKDTSLYQYALDWAESHNWEPTYGSLNTRDGDHQCCGQTYIELYLLDPKPEKIQPIKTNIDNMLATNKVDDWSWIDAIQMSMPVFAKLGAIYDDDKYYRRMHQMFEYSRNSHGANGLYNATDGLWYRDGDFDPPYTTPNGKSCYWSRGNGWVYAALVRVMDVIPPSLHVYDEYLTMFKEMSDALIACQREDGFWNSNLGDPDDFGGKESSGTAFFVYGLAWGINHGILDKETYLPAIVKGWNGLQNDALHNNGFLGWMQSTGKQPSDGQPLSYNKEPNFEDYGLGAFLLAGVETYKLASTVTNIEMVENDGIMVRAARLGSTVLQLQFTLEQPAIVSADLFNMKGQKVRQLVNKHPLQAGTSKLQIPESQLNSGLYFIQTRINNKVKTIKVKL